jgi:hypothetical protein
MCYQEQFFSSFYRNLIRFVTVRSASISIRTAYWPNCCTYDARSSASNLKW